MAGSASKGAEDAVLHSEELFRLLVESVEDYAIFVLDPRGVVTTWNAGAERIKGYRASEIVGQHFSRFYPAEDVASGKCDHVLEAATRDGRFEDEGWRVRKDGSRFWGHVVLTALRSSTGDVVGFAKVTRDMTERRALDEARTQLAQRTAELSESLEASLSTTLRSIGDAVIATDARGGITLMNPVAERLTGWSEAEAKGRPLVEVFRIVNEQTRAIVESPVDKVLEHGIIVGLANHTVLIARDGRDVPIDDSGAPIRRGDGPIEGVVLVFRDVSEQKRLEAREAFLAEATITLTQSLDYERTLSKVAELAVPRLADWAAVDLVQEGEAAAKRLAVAHVDRAKVELARELYAKYPPRLDAPTGVPHVLRTGRSELYADIPDELLVASCVDEEHLRIARALGLRSAMIVPLIARGRVLGALSFVSAESGRRYREEDLQHAEELARRCAIALDNARLFASEQEARRVADVANRAKDDFLATISHELRTPLMAIMGWSQMLVKASLDEARASRAIETIRRNAVAMAQLVEDLLDMSRIISGKMRLDVQQVDLGRVVELAIESIHPAAHAKGITIVPDLGDGLPPLSGDPTRLQQVVWNLLSNAVKFGADRGRVDVTLRDLDSSVELTVKDTGKGIAADFLPHVFDPFRQEDAGISRARGGLGLGLAITKQLVELHGGTITVHSEGEGCGSTFVVSLPVPLTTRMPPRPGSNPRLLDPALDRPPELQGLEIVLVDDEEDTRLLIKAILEACGCSVRAASNTDEALAAVALAKPDLLVSDIGMPGRDGYALIKELRSLPREKGGDIPAAALTAYARAEDRSRLLTAGYSMHIPKPVDAAELVAIVASLTRFAHRER